MVDNEQLREDTNQNENKVINNNQKENEYDLELILDIPLEISVELGRVKMIINELLQLGHGSIIDLEKPLGEPLDIFVNNKLIAKGEVVVVDQKFGIRVTDIISPPERVKSLGKQVS